MKDTTTMLHCAKTGLLLIIILLSGTQNAFPQIELLRGQKLKKWDIPAANYSGITPLGDNRYAVVSDKQDTDGFYEFRIVQNETTGRVEDVELIAFHGNTNPSRDAEGIAFFPDSNTVFISAEDDQAIIEYTLDGQQTGRSLAVPEEFSLNNIYGNYGFEALCYSRADSLFLTCTENSLRSDGMLPTVKSPVPARLRLQSFDTNLLPVRQYFYQTDVPKPGKLHRKIVAGVPEILALDDGRLLVLEREVMATRNNIGDRVDSRIYLFSPEDSTKTLQVQWSTRLNLTRRNLANYEGMCFGAKLKDGRQTILFISDAQNGAGNAVFRLKDYIRVGILDDKALILNSPSDNDENEASAATVYIPKSERILTNRWVQTAAISAPLIVAGLLVKGPDKHFRSLRNDYTPHYKASFDDYLQYSPLVVSYILKFAGVEGRSTWGKRLTANVISFGVVNLLSNGLKISCNVERPDGSNRHSMPSTHTASAFMAATMLYKEYGDLSPWVGYSAYTVATATGVMRMMHNKHWLSDILVGAGIGIAGAEFACWLSDKIFPSHAKSYDASRYVITADNSRPHFVETFAGFYVPLKHFSPAANPSLRSENGAVAGINGAYFFNRCVGIGGQASIADITYNDESETRPDATSRFYSLNAGCYFACPLHPRIALGARLLAGFSHYPRNKSNILDSGRNGGMSGMAGVNISYRAKPHFAFKAGIDYAALPSPVRRPATLHTLLFSGAAAIRF
ncbi:MAG: esterase-like activity of phytase family protein [Prevotella sp.]|nr:esterase-like activity of phytase family protein [Prevotella sp.]